ncbi:MAG: hypothetical protein K9N35_08440 [Candidatus Marinimicrobia bacterium]|nr:hypothetical protein [Candidatus Neomarinimicrobiota bacterium]
MTHLTKLTILISLAGTLYGLPRFAVMEEVSCSSCHSFSGGGAARTSYGKDFIRETLVMKDMVLPWTSVESERPFYLGFDTRYQFVSQEEKDLRHFPMQLALYGGVEWGSLILHAEVNRILEEFRFTGGIRYEGLMLDSWVSISREVPALGWRMDDHTLFTRGGNLTLLGLESEGMPYTPYLEAPTYLEIGSAPISGFEISVMLGTAFVNSGAQIDGAGFQQMKMTYHLSRNLFAGQTSIAYLKEAELSASTASWGLSLGHLDYLGEFSQLSGWSANPLDKSAVVHQLSYRLFPGVDLIARYEFYDPDRDLLTGAINRSSLGFEFFPLPGIEIKIAYRQSNLDLPESDPAPEGQYLGQIHFYL